MCGRPKGLTVEQQEVLDLYNAKEKPIPEICEVLGISRKTLYEYLKRRPLSETPAAGTGICPTTSCRAYRAVGQ